MEDWKIQILIKACIHYASSGYLKLGSPGIICFYEECLVMVCYFKDHVTEVLLNVMLGELSCKMEKFTESIQYLKRALVTAMKTNNKHGEAMGYLELGVTYGLSGDHQKAIFCVKKGQSIAFVIGNKKLEGIGFRNFGLIHSAKNEFHKAIECHKKHLTISQEIGDKMGQGCGYANLGETYMSLCMYQKALNCFKKRLNMYITKQICDNKGEGLTYAYMGRVYSLMGKHVEANECQEKYLNSIVGTNEKGNEATVNFCLGRDNEALFKRDKAVEHYENYRLLSTELGDEKGQRHAYHSLRDNYSCLADYYEAIKNQENVLSITKANGDKKKEGREIGCLGYLYDSLGDYSKAHDCHQKALDIAIERGDTRGEGHAYFFFCRTYPIRGQYEEAIEYSEKSLSIAKKIGDKNLERNVCNVLGLAYLGKGECNNAKKLFERAIEIAKEMGHKYEDGNAYSNIGLVYMVLRQYHLAIKYFKKADKIDCLLDQKSQQHKTYYNLGFTYYCLGIESIQTRLDVELYRRSMDKSKKYLNKSIQCAELMTDKLRDRDDLKVPIGDTFIPIYKCLTEVLINEKKVKEALLVSEQGKARALSDLFISKYMGNAKRKQLEYVEVERFLSESDVCFLYFSLQFKRVALWVLAPQNSFSPWLIAESKSLNRLTDDSKGAYEAIEEVVNAAYEEMNVSDVECENRSLESPELSSPNDLPSKRNGKEGESYFDKVSQTKTKDNQLDVLYNILFASQNVFGKLTQEDVVIIPDGPLFMVPFAALQDPDTGLFLSEMKRIRLAPSLTTMKILQECPPDYHNKTGALVVGDPVSGEVMFRGKKNTFSQLPKAQHEAEIIASILNVTPLIGADAAKDVIMKRLHEGVAVIHIAAHGSTEGEIVLAPRALTGKRSIPEEEDYLLTMKEVQETGIKAQLVVLSCCHSGRGEIKAEGIVGISRGFLAAGARAVVASLWGIDDEATRSFMVGFYTQLKMGESASASLQQAMKGIREEGYSKPKHWAPFFLIGDDITIRIR